MIDGQEVTLAGKVLIIPPLNLSGLKKIDAGLKTLNDPSISNFDKMDTMILAIKLAIHRNYPDMLDEEIEDIVDLQNMTEVFNAVMAVSGVKKVVGEQIPGALTGELSTLI